MSDSTGGRTDIVLAGGDPTSKAEAREVRWSNLIRVAFCAGCVFALVAATGCVKRQTATTPVTLELQVQLFGPLKVGEDEPYPSDLVGLHLPITVDECPNRVFLPRVELLDQTSRSVGAIFRTEANAEERYQELSQRLYEGGLGGIRKAVQQPPSVADLRKFVAQDLEQAPERPELASLEPQAKRLDAHDLRGYAAGGCVAVLVASPEEEHRLGEPLGNGAEKKTAIVFSDPKQLLEEIARRTCDDRSRTGHSTSSGSTAATCRVLYHPGSEPAVVVGPGGATDNGETSDEPDEEGPLHEPVDELYQQLAKRVATATPSERPEVLRQLMKAETTHSHDYRFTYERVRLSVYGLESHHEAFSLLAVAAEKAIKNGQSGAMLTRLLEDAETDHEGIWKLAHGHAGQWQPIVSALRSQRVTTGLAEAMSGEHHH